MSIDTGTPDPYAAPGLQCPACFPANETPKFIYVAFADIKKGDLWAPPNPLPMNGIHKLEVWNPCQWLVNYGPWDVLYNPTAIPSRCSVTGPLHQLWFFGRDPIACTRWYENEIDDPFNVEFWGGIASIWDFTSSDESTIQENLALMNIAPGENTYVNLRTTPGDTAVKIISSHRENINIAIKEDIP